MNQPDQSGIRNGLLRALKPDDFAIMTAHLRPVVLQQRQTLLREGELIDHVWFPETALVALVVSGDQGQLVETGMFGFEGCSDNVLSPGKDRSTFRSIVQIGGAAHVMRAADYAACLRSRIGVLEAVVRFQQVLTTQLIYTSLANASLTVAGRLARWLLMLQDRAGDQLPLVQDWIALMLCVTRTPVSEAIQRLEADGAIKAERGQITIVNRAKLKTCCGTSYGPPEEEYERVLGPFWSARGPAE